MQKRSGKTAAGAKPGSGKNFAALKSKIAQEKGYSQAEAAAVAASIGRKKYGAAKMTKMAQAGRARKQGQ